MKNSQQQYAFVPYEKMDELMEMVKKLTTVSNQTNQKENSALGDYISEKEAKIPLVETAIKNKETGEIELMGPKHNEQRKLETIDTHDQGFITEDNRFLDRKQAFEQAKRSGQIPEGQNPTDISIGLRSEDLRIAGDKRFAITEEQPAGVPKPPIEDTVPKSRQDFKTLINDKEFRQNVSLKIDMVEAERSGDIRGIAELKAEDARLTAEIEQLHENIPDVKFADVNKNGPPIDLYFTVCQYF